MAGVNKSCIIDRTPSPQLNLPLHEVPRNPRTFFVAVCMISMLGGLYWKIGAQ